MQLHIQSDTVLWEKFLEGDLKAYTVIYERTVQGLFQYGMLYSSDRELVKDCIHDVFVKIYTNHSTLSPTDNIMAYLSVALKHTILNALKRKEKYSSVDEIRQEDMSNYAETPETMYLNSELEKQTTRKIHSVMSKLTIRQREIMYYRYIKDMSIDEISKLTQMNYQSVANTIQRSLTRMRMLFKKK
nr:sigma-70 family RNA polymerase sigma factor [uncultured Bacteroides sp.]